MPASNKNPVPQSVIELPRWVILVALAIIVCGTSAIRLRLADMPLERDEGEYAYAGQLMLQGIPPYKLAYNMKLPGTYASYAVIMAVLGETSRGIHLGLIAVNSITTLLIYVLGRRLFGQICGLGAAACFALLALSDSVLGLAGHATHFVTLFAMAGLSVLLAALRTARLQTFFWAGLLFGLAFLMKQTAVFFGIFGGLLILWQELRRRPLLPVTLLQSTAIYSVGAILPFAATLAIVIEAGVLHRFWFWTFQYAQEYVANPVLWYESREFKFNTGKILASSPGIWILALIGLVVSLVCKKTRPNGLLTFALLVASFATACPGFYFRQHYFIPLLPAAALFVGAGLEVVCQQAISNGRAAPWKLSGTVALGLIAMADMLFRHRLVFFELSPVQTSRLIYGINPFPEARQIANYIREHSKPDARVAVLGSEPEIYFYSHRHSATGYIYMFPLMELQKYAGEMQREAIQEIEEAKPEIVVFVSVRWSWGRHPESNSGILEWADKYVEANLEQIGLADIQSMDRTVYRWGEKAVAAIPRSPQFLWVLKRRDLD